MNNREITTNPKVPTVGNRKSLYSVAVCVLLFTSATYADTATWNAPDLDTWTYPAAGSPGMRTLGPTFLTSPGLDDLDQFLPSSGRDPARRGMTYAAFNTSTNIPAGLDSARYLVNSVTVEFTMQFGTAGDVLYDDTPETNAELLADYVSGNIDTARPMELFGLAFQADYTGFDFAQEPGAQPFGENTYPYSPSDATGVLAAYPIGSDVSGAHVDISNSLTGGYSATAPGNDTAPFDPTPWSIGTVAGLSPGDVIPADTTFEFAVNLTLPGVSEYVEQSLADGALGFALSSQHFTGDPHNGAIVPYPQWYLKEFPGNFGGVPPTLTVDYTILPLPGDFDNDGDVDADDLTDPVEGWEARYGVDLDGSDFLAWQRNNTGPIGLASAVPEPNSLVLVLILLVLIVLSRSSRGSRNTQKQEPTLRAKEEDATPAFMASPLPRLSPNNGPIRLAARLREKVS